MSKQTALITGASSGIGKAFAYLLADKDYDLVLTARRTELLHEIANELIHRYNIRVTVITADLAQPDSISMIVEQLRQQQINIDLLINNAGFGQYGKFIENDATINASMIAVNITALMQLTHALLPEMLKRPHAKILNVASIAGFQPGPYMAVYCATKAFVVSFSQALAEELRHSNVRVSALCPGVTQTEFFTRANMEKTTIVKRRRVWVTAEKVAAIGYRGLMRGQRIIMVNFASHLLTLITRIAPSKLVTGITALVIK